MSARVRMPELQLRLCGTRALPVSAEHSRVTALIEVNTACQRRRTNVSHSSGRCLEILVRVQKATLQLRANWKDGLREEAGSAFTIGSSSAAGGARPRGHASIGSMF